MSESEGDLAQPAPPPTSELAVVMLLADAAQVAEGRLYVLGGGLSVVGPRPQPIAVALSITVPWEHANVTHEWILDLLDVHGAPVPDPERALAVGGRFEAGRPARSATGSPLRVPLAINFPTVPVEPGQHYVWQLSIDEATRPDWRAWFHVRR